MPSGTDFGVVSPGDGGSNFLTITAYQSGPVSAVLQSGGKGAFQLISMQSYRRVRTFPGGGLHNPQLRRPVVPRSAGLSPHIAPVWNWVLDQQGTDSLAKVSKGEMIEIIVNFYAPSLELAANVPQNDTYTATLSINGPGTQVRTFTLIALRGAFVVTPSPAQFSTRHGLQTAVALNITSLCGPATNVVFQNQSNDLLGSIGDTRHDRPASRIDRQCDSRHYCFGHAFDRSVRALMACIRFRREADGLCRRICLDSGELFLRSSMEQHFRHARARAVWFFLLHRQRRHLGFGDPIQHLSGHASQGRRADSDDAAVYSSPG